MNRERPFVVSTRDTGCLIVSFFLWMKEIYMIETGFQKCPAGIIFNGEGLPEAVGHPLVCRTKTANWVAIQKVCMDQRKP
jgi:hypothetical protein